MFGKTTFISILSKLIKNKKILIIDFNLVNNDLYSVFNVKNIPQKLKEKIKEKDIFFQRNFLEKHIEYLITKIDMKVDLISLKNPIFDEKYIWEEELVEEILKKFKEKYDLILIDTTSDKKYEIIERKIVNLSDINICLTEGNVLGIRKTDKFLKENNLNNKKVKIIYNKKNEYTIKPFLLRIKFSQYKYIGKLNYSNKYDEIINKKVNRYYIDEKIKMEFKNIINKI